jgi:hypothetical protein
VTLVSGFQCSNGSRWGRVVDAVPGPDGSLSVTDDTAGAIYRVTPGGSRAGEAVGMYGLRTRGTLESDV